MKPVIVKVGGAVFACKESEEPRVDRGILERVADEIAEARRGPMVVIHGAGSYGHPIVKRTGIHMGISSPDQLLAFAETQRLQNELNVIFTKALIEKGIPAFPFQPSTIATMSSRRLSSLYTTVLRSLLSSGLVPVLYGVPAYDTAQVCSILSGDDLAVYLARELGAERVVFATDVDGVFTDDPRKNPGARLIREIRGLDGVEFGGREWDVTGAMGEKVRKVLEAGVEAVIVNGLVPGRLRDAILGREVVGTRIIGR